MTAQHQHAGLKSAAHDLPGKPIRRPTASDDQPANSRMSLEALGGRENGGKILSIADVAGEHDVEFSVLRGQLDRVGLAVGIEDRFCPARKVLDAPRGSGTARLDLRNEASGLRQNQVAAVIDRRY